MRPLELPDRARILVVALRRLGDVLLTTPLIRSLRAAWPNSRIEALVFSDTAGILAGNPDVDRILAMPVRPTAAQSIALGAELFKRYALAISTQSGDRPTLFALLAGRRHAGLVGASDGIKRRALNYPVPIVPGLHRVEEVLRLADMLGVPRAATVICPAGEALPASVPAEPYAIVHAAPMFRYKQWTTRGWRTLAATLRARGLAVVATGGPSEAERVYLDEVWKGASVQRLDGELSWPQLARALTGARVFVGPDTSVTHLAAASGCPTVALYGPTDPRLWGPWPASGQAPAWTAASTIQRADNIWLVQNPLPCVPCQNEGCGRNIASYSRCLDELSPEQVLMAVDEALTTSR